MDQFINLPYCPDQFNYKRRETVSVNIGDVPCGSQHPIRIQSMTTVDTMDTIGSVEQVIRMVESGCEYVRITAPSLKEAQNLAEIKKSLRAKGYQVPLVADIHFTPNAAELAARIVEKVRVNPGNYADKKRFDILEYDDASYQAELDRIRERFLPLVKICKEEGTAMRIGTNHGSLSDRILSRYGDTPNGMVESAFEFLRICEDENYHDIVISMKASNTRVMVQAYRLLVARLDAEKFKPYPLHLGVTEAGEGEDGRVKSAVGIGTLLEDGLGDTVRVSLTEEPEFEAPVAKMLVDRYVNRTSVSGITSVKPTVFNPFEYKRRVTNEVGSIGLENVPRVIADFSQKDLSVESIKQVGHFYMPLTDKWSMNDLGVDMIYTGDSKASFMLPNGLKELMNANSWIEVSDKEHCYPLFTANEFLSASRVHPLMNLVKVEAVGLDVELLSRLKTDKSVVLVLESFNEHQMADLRSTIFKLDNSDISVPVVFKRQCEEQSSEQLQLHASTDLGGLLVDGFGDGVWLSPSATSDFELKELNNLSFGILQAARTRMSKTEYISCPSCGRTLFDLQETTAMIRKRTDHLKGVKIGIMGCIVNGPGEMADADYGYVGSGPGKITLYKGQEVMKKGVPSAGAVDELINIIKEDGNWVDPQLEELTA